MATLIHIKHCIAALDQWKSRNRKTLYWVTTCYCEFQLCAESSFECYYLDVFMHVIIVRVWPQLQCSVPLLCAGWGSASRAPRFFTPHPSKLVQVTSCSLGFAETIYVIRIPRNDHWTFGSSLNCPESCHAWLPATLRACTPEEILLMTTIWRTDIPRHCINANYFDCFLRQGI